MAKVKRRDGSHLFLAGRTRSGKSVSASRSVASKRRVLVWDPQLDWLRHGCERVDTIRDLVDRILAEPGAPARLCFKGGVRDAATFEKFCRVAFSWGRYDPATIIVEELSWVTSPGKAPTGWHELVTGGLKYGIDLVSITQRPQESDKTALSQADIVRCFSLERATDQRYMAGELGVDVGELRGLAPLHYVEKNRRTIKVTTGRLTF